MAQLVERFAGSRNINQLIVEHIPSKTAKQISDKWCLLGRGPLKEVSSRPEGGVGKENHSKSARSPKERQLKLQYYDAIKTGLSVGRFARYQEAFEKILDGQDPQVVVNDVFEEFRGSLSGLSQSTMAARDQKPQTFHSQRAYKKSYKKREVSLI